MPQKIKEEENVSQSYSLYELTTQVRRTLEDSFADAYWVRAELAVRFGRVPSASSSRISSWKRARLSPPA